MLRISLAVPFIVSLACSCASVPAKPTSGEPLTGPSATTGPSASKEVTSTVVSEQPMGPSPVLGPGRCVDGFDCVDTVGFPASGYRWDCVKTKCERAKLPMIGGETPAAETETTADNTKSKSKSRKSGKRTN